MMAEITLSAKTTAPIGNLPMSGEAGFEYSSSYRGYLRDFPLL